MLNVLKKEERTFDYLKSKIKLKFIRDSAENKEKEKKEKSNQNINAFMVDTIKRDVCGGLEHIEHFCDTKNQGTRGKYRGRASKL